MIRKRWILILLPLAIHLLLGTVLLIIDAVHGVNDQDFSFAVALLFYYLNWPAAQGLHWMGVELTIMRLMLAGLPIWFGLGGVLWAAGTLFGLRRCPKDSGTV